MTFDRAKFMSALRADPQLKGHDLDAFEQRYSDLLRDHGAALDEMARNVNKIIGARLRDVMTMDPERTKREILERELQTTGIDWARFYAGKQDEHEAVTRHLRQLKLSFTADDLLRGKARDAQSDAHPEYVTPAEAQNLRNICHGDTIKNTVIARANAYQQIKAAAASGSTLSTVMGMLNGGILAFGPDAAKAAIHAMGSGASPPAAIAAGIAFLTLDTVGLIVAAIFILLWAVVLLLTPCTLTGMVINWTSSGLLFDDAYVDHGDSIITTTKPSANYIGATQITADAFIDLGATGQAVSVGYLYHKGAQVAVVGVQGALRLGLYRPTWDPGTTGLGQSHIYTGWVIPKIGSSHARGDITSDASAKAFYDNHSFPTEDTSATSGPLTVETRLSDYSYMWSSRDIYQFTIVVEQGLG
jgi:hypothetical protein